MWNKIKQYWKTLKPGTRKFWRIVAGMIVAFIVIVLFFQYVYYKP